MEELKPYIVEFDKVSSMNCKVRENNQQPIIIISHNEYIFSANNGI